jgi:Methyl-accepting chemotaxis protein (MCP) signalling domain
MHDSILDLALEVSKVTGEKVSQINSIMRQTRLLALNARIEAERAGAAGGAFGIVAQEIGAVSNLITQVAADLSDSVASNLVKIESAGSEMMRRFSGARFQDIALNAVELIDRNLYERSCDVRWWATDSAVVDAVENGSPTVLSHATERLQTILRSYTVYLDLWIADANGMIVASGRPDRYPGVTGANVAEASWFRNGKATISGDDFAVVDVEREQLLEGAAVAAYSTAIRAGGRSDGKVLGVLGIFFDWMPQAKAIVTGVGLSSSEKAQSKVMLLDRRHRIIAASDGVGVLDKKYQLHPNAEGRGYYIREGSIVSYAVTPGYETYKGLGWYGVVEYRMEDGQGKLTPRAMQTGAG